jgi:replicative DNA helicase
MFLVTGKSHSGKSTVAYNMVVHNLRRSEDFTAVLFSPDEPRELAMQKLFCIAMGRNALEVEDAIRRGDESAQRELENAANGLLDRVLINDQSLSFPQMLDAIWEAKEYWGAAPSACVIDYLELLHGTSDANGVAAKAQGAKRFAKDADVPLIVLHQTGRGASERGKPAGIHGARFGGENESVAVLECYRPKDRTDLSPRELTMVEDVVRLNLVKNKRPPYRLIDTEMILDPINGRIRELSIDDIEEREWIM